MDQGKHNAYQQAFARLNKSQKQAVEQIDGPLLVIAGPGTGKTQLLSARVAHILQVTDTLPQNILCLTFTESGASNMRERLTRFIGQAAYEVNIGTYHSFGGELIRRFPQYFGETRAESPADELTKRQIVAALVDSLAYTNPLKSTQYHLQDLISTISEVKRGLLTVENLQAIGEDNLAFITEANAEIKEIFADFTRMPTKLDKAAPFFKNLRDYLQQRDQAAYTIGSIRPLASTVLFELEQALDKAADEQSTKPLTAWKNHWLEKDQDNNFVLAGQRASERIVALAAVFEAYQAELSARGLYDFDDMILRSIKALEQHNDLRFTLQEQYLYIMLDEFQDTNAAQLKLIELLTNNPVAEGRPNVMAVGDDDQAIYSFQGAEYSNMMDFYGMYRDVSVVNLTENYRSHADILHVAHQVAGQIGSRLHHNFKDMSKILVAANRDLPASAHIERREFLSDVGQYEWLAKDIKRLIEQGVPASEIAVLAPRHKQLEPLVPFLNALDIPVRYEKRENILEAPITHQLLTMSKLVLALQAGNEAVASSLWPEVLSYAFWGLPVEAIWQLSWQVRDDPDLTWSQALLQHHEPLFRTPAMLFLGMSQQATFETLETMLDYLIGNQALQTKDTDHPLAQSPLREYYLSPAVRQTDPDLFYETYSHLTVLRQKLQDHQGNREEPLHLQDLIDFVGLYEAAEARMLNTSPYNQHAEAVQLMTVFKAKGLEFDHVFLPSCQDDVWGESSRANSNRLTLPANLVPIRPAGTTEDERLRIFFVALTRAKQGLHLTSFLQTYSGRTTKRLKYLNEQQQSDGFQAMVLPDGQQAVQPADGASESPSLATLELNWQLLPGARSNWRQRHLEGVRDTRLRDLLEGKISNYRLSATHLNVFTDMVHGGPESFLFDCILQFPHAPASNAQFGNAIHETLQWLQHQIDASGHPPTYSALEAYFDTRMRSKKLRTDETERLVQRGHHALKAYWKQRGSIFKPGDKAEFGFRNEGVVIDGFHLAGKIDRMEIDTANKTITVVDYKTGSTYNRWLSDIKLHKYKHQLYCYKLLIEHSRTYRGYKVVLGRLEFIEPDDQGRIHTLELKFTDTEEATTRALLAAMWHCVQNLEFPDVSGYDTSLAGTKAFEASLLAANQ